MKVLRIIVGVLLLGIGLYVLVGEHFAGTSADATVNARLYVIRAPIEGNVTLAVKNIGARVNAGELVADLIDDRFDTARLLGLERDRDTQKIELKRIERNGPRYRPRRLHSRRRPGIISVVESVKLRRVLRKRRLCRMPPRRVSANPTQHSSGRLISTNAVHKPSRILIEPVQLSTWRNRNSKAHGSEVIISKRN